MSVAVGQRRIMRDGTYATVEEIGPERTQPYPHGMWQVCLSMIDGSVTIYRAYSTVNGWPLTPCTNESHTCLADCLPPPWIPHP